MYPFRGQRIPPFWRNEMNIQQELQENYVRIADINKQLTEINKKIGGLQEEGRAILGKGMELKGAIDLLLKMEAQEKAKTGLILPPAGLILPEGTNPVVASDTAPVPPTEGTTLDTAEGAIPADGGK
jgi:hypothetical protein